MFCQRSGLDSGKKIGVWKFGGVIYQRSDLDLGKKVGVLNFGGRGILPKVGFGLWEENWSLEIWGRGVLYQISE